MYIFDLLRFGFGARNEIVENAALNGGRTVERDDRNQIEQRLRLQLLYELDHACGLDLKTPERIASSQHIESLFIVER